VFGESETDSISRCKDKKVDKKVRSRACAWLLGQAAKALSSATSQAKTDEMAQPSSSSSSSSSSSNREIEDDDEDDQDVSFLFPIRPQAGGPTEP
jgi:hypothetical protein